MKKKIFMLTLVACLIVLSIAGSSLAYFTDTDAKTNVFTLGNVDITLTYNNDATKLYPGQSYAGATIENIGSENAFVGAIIDVTLPNYATGVLSDDRIIGIFDGLNAHTFKYETTASGGYKIYVVMPDQLGITDATKTATVFSSISIPAKWNNTEMAIFKDMVVEVTGYAVQTVGLNNATEALTAAFDAWENYPNI